MNMHNTTKYINVLSKIVDNYNNTYHTAIKMKPIDVKNNEESITRIINKKYNQAKEEEIVFEIGDQVRYIINPVSFSKRSLPKWSKVVHTITNKNVHSYKLDNGSTYKYYELQKIKNNEDLNKISKLPTREDLRKKNTIKRKLKRENIDLTNILTQKRERKKVDKLGY